MRMNLIFELARDNPTLAWTTFTQNVDALMTPFASAAPLILALGCPETRKRSGSRFPRRRSRRGCKPM